MAHRVRIGVTKEGLVRLSCIWCGFSIETGTAGKTTGAVVAELRPAFHPDIPCGPLEGLRFRLLKTLAWMHRHTFSEP